ncbi:MAG: methionine--tRNA ligase, partial [bacterium]
MRYLVTSALPYANGTIHLGHVAGAYLPADIYVRFLKNRGDEVIYICGTDEHGVPIAIAAEKEGISPEELVEKNHSAIKASFDKININFSIFSGTHNKTHEKLSQEFFTKLKKEGHLVKKKADQFFCEKCNKYLPDRYVEGCCPICKSEDARGDQCDSCGNSLDALDLVDARCKICNETPSIRSTEHWFLKLGDFQEKLKRWLEGKKHWKRNVREFCNQWFERGLDDRCITRDLSWGVPLPDEDSEGKVLYVWFDAPIGYISFTRELFNKLGKSENEWESWWKGGDDVKLVHFIGKDNIVFHAMIFPAMLMGQEEGYKCADEIPANEYLNLEGGKFSTSKDHAIWIDDFTELFSPDTLRFYLAKIAPENRDSNFSLDGFRDVVNSEFAGIYGNFINRHLSFVKRFFKGKLRDEFSYGPEDENVWKDVCENIKKASECFETFKVRDALANLVDAARKGNKYFDTMAPWNLRKTDKARCRAVLLTCLNIADALSSAFEPITPETSRKIKDMLNMPHEFDISDIENKKI